jgi:hypothetical protein
VLGLYIEKIIVKPNRTEAGITKDRVEVVFR